MKKYFNFTLLTFAILLFTGCSSEEEIADNGGVPSLKGTLTFVLPMAKGATTYAIATTNENKLDIPGMKIYMFSDAADPVLEKVYSGADIVSGSNGTNATASITVPEGVSGNKTFYFAGNTATVQGTATNQLGTTAEGMLLSVFSKLITDNQLAPAHLSSANGLLLTGKSATINVASTASANVSLKRRVARFDVDNTTSASNVTIKEILIYNANLAGYVFENPTPDIAANLTKGDLTKITYTGQTNANTGITESVFYLYPTVVGSTTTIIQLVTDVKGTEKIFTVKAADILPNKRYFIKAKENNGIEFVLEVADWESAGDLETEVQGAVGFSNVASSDLTGWNANTYMFDATNNGTTITLDVATPSSKGAEFEIVNTLGSFPGITTETTSTPALTYAASYKQGVKITIPKYEGTDDLTVEIRIKDKANPKLYATVVVYSDKTGTYYPGTTLKPVVVAGVTWAPVNVGATTDDATVLNLASTGYYYQWGRNSFKGASSNLTNTIAGPLGYDEANNSTQFISRADNINGDWLKKDDSKYTDRASLWTTGATSPCPAGWSVPTVSQLDLLNKSALVSITGNTEKKRNEIKDKTTNAIIYLPFGGAIMPNGGATWLGTGAMLWSSTPAITASKTNGQMLLSGGATPKIIETPVSYGAPIRCVKN
ncbi:putative repeat protein [Dysgonomonas alginatilytica]|uniref:Putative repeat protein n=1 Tax=Dysgonomonas alginatilytica TaxID=1605892 RepID=A0A2V3PQR5_9BACT|nr:hypothetical protein [Dysgonomonas alginatilytica]PXV59438.1 putative repeat protein [Dysgonomonas alginatilytica]